MYRRYRTQHAYRSPFYPWSQPSRGPPFLMRPNTRNTREQARTQSTPSTVVAATLRCVLKSDTVPTMQTKRKVSVTVPEDLLEEVDRLAGALSRSAVFEEALVSWIRQHRQGTLDHAIERYYRALSQEERAEDTAWAALGDETIRDRWGESD